MKNINRTVAILATLALSACVTKGTSQSGANATLTSYQCSDGSLVEASYPTTDTARIIHQGRSVEMTIAVSASGTRYVGGGWEWWTKGTTEAMLAPLAEGEDIASAQRVNCTAP